MLYHNHRSELYFTFLKKGQKTIEGRVREGKYAQIKAGDEIIVHNNEETDSVRVKVLKVTNYPSFKDLLTNENLQKVLPDIQTVDEGVELYRKFYTSEEEQKFGVVAIDVALL